MVQAELETLLARARARERPLPRFVERELRGFLRCGILARVLTDSGGLQEEAPGLGKPVLVMRDVTERPEPIAAGTAALVGTSARRIVEAMARLHDEPARVAGIAASG